MSVSDASTGPRITERRTIPGLPAWTISEFDVGERFMLVANSLHSQFSVHFAAEEWRAFQDFVSPPRSEIGADGT